MNALLTYAVGSAAVLAVLWGGFRLLLRSQKTFRVNRILLNVILYFSLCAPLLLSCLSIPVPDGRDQGAVGLMTLSGITVSAGDVGGVFRFLPETCPEWSRRGNRSAASS